MTAAIQLQGLGKRYGTTIGGDGLDLEVEPGEAFGLLGPSGAGKTAAIRCLVDPLADHRRLAPRVGCLPGALQEGPTPRRAGRPRRGVRAAAARAAGPGAMTGGVWGTPGGVPQ